MKKELIDFYENPDKHLPINEIGDLVIQSFYDRYAGLRLTNNIPIFNRTYEKLVENKNFSRGSSREIYDDYYMWAIKHKDVKVIVVERQSCKYIYISDGWNFHIRALDHYGNYPSWRKKELKGIKINDFKRQNFKPYIPKDINEKKFRGFTYGDSRDDGYILSMGYFKECERANMLTLNTISLMTDWEDS